MILSKEGLNRIEHQAEAMRDVSLMFQVQILREIREMKELLEVHQESRDCGDAGKKDTDNSEN